MCVKHIKKREAKVSNKKNRLVSRFFYELSISKIKKGKPKKNSVNNIISLRENVPLAPLTTLKIGGEARLFVRTETEEQVVEAFKFAEKNEIDVFILGGGSNVLIADEGFDGLVLHIALKGIEFKGNVAEVKAGEDWDRFVAIAVGKNLAGVECLSGIPGFTGGTPVQNVGAYGQEVSETITRVRVFDRKSGEILELTNADCKFAYRSSIFNTKEKNRFIVLSVTFKLNDNGEPKIVYKDLREFFGERAPNLRETREAVLQIRRAKSMVIEDGDPNSKSAGSFFKNPVVSKSKFHEITEIAESLGFSNVPNFPFDDQSVKIPAAWLIERSGFQKGFVRGNAGLSTNHTLALINLGNSTAQEIIELKNEIQDAVKRKFGIELAPEPVFVGF
jgi:UDP-N-acetylmuramate dehydrogenase